MKQLRIATLGDWNHYLSYFLVGTMEGAVRNGAWFRPIPLFGPTLKQVEEQIQFFKPHILFCHCIFNTAPHKRDDVFAMLRRVKKSGVFVCYHAGDARTEPRYPGDISGFVSHALVNHGLLEKFSGIWKIPTTYWPYGCLYQSQIAEPDERYACQVAFSGSLSESEGHVHWERTQFLKKLGRHVKVRLFPDAKLGNTSFQTAELAASAQAVLDVQMRDDIPMYLSVRPFQYIGAGALLFHDDNDHINPLFVEGRHYVGYRKCDADSFLEKYRYHVERRPEEGRRIREEGFRYAQKHHGMQVRVKQVIDLYEGRPTRIRMTGRPFRVFESAEIKGDRIEIDGRAYRLVRGKHALYVPELGLKIVWSYNGRIESYVDWDKGRNAAAILGHTFNDGTRGFDPESLESVINEYLIFEELAAAQMAPPVRGLAFIRNMVSDFLYGSRHCDPRGCYGFFIDDAGRLGTPGRFDLEEFRTRYIESGRIRATDNAVGDLQKADNVVNGYLIDVRRTLRDMIQLADRSEFADVRQAIEQAADEAALVRKIRDKTVYPKGEKLHNYQSYRLGDRTVEGERKIPYRFERMGLPDRLEGRSVLDLGCNLGAMCIEAYARGARQVVGLDIDPDYIECARDLARANGYQINYLQMDLRRVEEAAAFACSYFKKPIDLLFALSICEPLDGSWQRLLELLDWKTAYLESYNAPQELESDHVKEIRRFLDGQSFMRAEYLGQTHDHRPRCLWRLEKLSVAAPAAADA